MDKPRKDPLRYYYYAISVLGLVLLAVDANMSRKFGATFDDTAMVGLTALSIGSGILLVLAIQQWRRGHKEFAKVIAASWALCFAFNVISNMGVATSVRLAETQTATVQKAVHEQRSQSTAEAKARLVIFEKQLATLMQKNAWAATVTATGLRDQVASLKAARDSESALGGCGPKCRALENQIIGVQGKVAIAEQRENLDKRIAATKRILAEARDKLQNTDAGVSLVANQASLYPRWTVGWFSSNAETAGAIRNSNELLGILMALVIAVASASLTLAGAWPELMRVTPDNDNEPDGPSSPRTALLSPGALIAGPATAQRVLPSRDTSFAEAVRAACNRVQIAA